MIGSLHMRLGKLDIAMEAFDNAKSIQLQELGSNSYEFAVTASLLAEVYFKQGKLSDSLCLFRESLSNFMMQENYRDKTKDHIFNVSCHIAEIYEKSYSPDKAAECYNNILTFNRTRTSKCVKSEIFILIRLGELHLRWGSFEKALTMFKEASLMCLKPLDDDLSRGEANEFFELCRTKTTEIYYLQKTRPGSTKFARAG